MDFFTFLSSSRDEEKWCGVVVVFFRGGNKGQTKQTLLLHIGANKN